MAAAKLRSVGTGLGDVGRIGWLAVTTVELDPHRTALVLVDLMPRIIALPTEPFSGVDVLDRCLSLAGSLRAAGGLVVFVTVERPGVEVQPPGSELAAECEPAPGDVRIVKRTWGAFQNTGLDGVLRARGIKTVVLGGLVTNFGIESTGRAADEHDYSVVFVSDAMAGLHEHAHTFAVEYVFPRLGVVRTSAEVLASLGADT
jgi:nicotinamidase-related amidase